MNKINQFIKFEPILKEKIWGGDKLYQILDKKALTTNIGESWEISSVTGNVSVISNGALKGLNLQQLIQKYKGNLLGEKIYDTFGENFPLLVKFIDAKKDLSIQVHPNDKMAKEKHNSLGKTEMWYIMDSDVDAELIVGFNKDTDKREYLEHLKEESLLDILNVEKVNKGDVYFIPAGRVHAIKAGTLLAEIQETSDITYRIYDWNRKDTNGNYRDLHTEEALEVIDFSYEKEYRTNYEVANQELTSLVSCPHFTTNILSVSVPVLINHQQKDSFVIYMCVKGEVVFNYKNVTEKIVMGQTLLVPACIKEFTIKTTIKSELLEVYIE